MLKAWRLYRGSLRWSSTAVQDSRRPKSIATDSINRRVERQLIARQPAGAISTFSKDLKISSFADLDACLDLFQRFTTNDCPRLLVDAFKLFVKAGYAPSALRWTQLLKSNALTIGEFEQLLEATQPPLLDHDALATATVDFFAKTGGPTQAESLFFNYMDALKAKGRYPSPPAFGAVINARGMLGDLRGAAKWFEYWRTGEKLHPYGKFDTAHRHNQIRKWLESYALLPPDWKSAYTARLVPHFVTPDLRPEAEQVLEMPAPQPYLALLEIFAKNKSKGSLPLLSLMVKDRVALTTRVYNTLMRFELRWKKNSHYETILALYQRMKEQGGTAMPDSVTFHLVFKAYREPRGLPITVQPRPSALLEILEIRGADDDLLENPRAVFQDMVQAYPPRALQSANITSKTLDLALGAFLRSRDFLGARAVLDVYKFYQAEPTIATHVRTFSALVRAQSRGEGFLTVQGKGYLNELKKREMSTRIEQLQSLVGNITEITEVTASRTPETQTSAHAADDEMVNITTSKSPALWGGRSVPRTPHELRKTRRFELRDLDYLKEALFYASHYASSIEQWQNALAKVKEEDLGLGMLSRRNDRASRPAAMVASKV